jgi:hypothetical protein
MVPATAQVPHIEELGDVEKASRALDVLAIQGVCARIRKTRHTGPSVLIGCGTGTALHASVEEPGSERRSGWNHPLEVQLVETQQPVNIGGGRLRLLVQPEHDKFLTDRIEFAGRVRRHEIYRRRRDDGVVDQLVGFGNRDVGDYYFPSNTGHGSGYLPTGQLQVWRANTREVARRGAVGRARLFLGLGRFLFRTRFRSMKRSGENHQRKY